ncbi:MAG: NAD-dependent succinate-semialdehyde dehydrogenase, partial [Candidatus Marinimicrobia bacterium]|nr:NAD-dependent succinate-semialdehyde dehydrogenase [Candidatus Neomarinimicrobiota bacterium]
MLQSINPFNQEVIHNYKEHSLNELNHIIAEANNEFTKWKQTNFDERAELLRDTASILKKNIKIYSTIMTVEMGKSICESRTEIEKCAWVCEYYAENGQKFLSPQEVITDASKSYVTFQPLGVILAIMPWNFPFWQVFRFAAPTLMAGNVGILKHSSNVSGCALAIEQIFRDAGFPENAFRTLLINSKKVVSIIENPAVKAVTLTGSTPAGKVVASKAGEMLKKTVLELGGSDPYIILGDADLQKAVNYCSISKLINAGQSCIAAKRFIVIESVLQEFQSLLIQNMKNVIMGDPFDKNINIGPMARIDLRDELHQQVVKSVKLGAQLLLGGQIQPSSGAFYPPTILADVKPGMPAFDEELFGPVAAIVSAKDEKEAIQLANNSVFGLGAAVFTQDIAHGEKISSEKLEAGSCFVNNFVKSDPRLPFGGIKQ